MNYNLYQRDEEKKANQSPSFLLYCGNKILSEYRNIIPHLKKRRADLFTDAPYPIDVDKKTNK